MPNDDWAKANSKDRGNAAKASGNYFRAAKKRLKRPRQPARSRKKPCDRCRGRQETTTVQVFKDGTAHLRVECSTCKSFKRWAPI